MYFTDKDLDKNAEIRYNISNNGGNNEFTLDSITGKLTVKNSLDREKKASMKLQITAQDLGSPPLSSAIDFELTLLDVNDNAPKFEGPKQHTVKENVKRGTLVFTAVAKDVDEG